MATQLHRIWYFALLIQWYVCQTLLGSSYHKISIWYWVFKVIEHIISKPDIVLRIYLQTYLVKHTAKRTQFLLQISTCFLYTSIFFLYLKQPFFKIAGKRRFWYEHKYMVQLVSRNSIFHSYRYNASINIPLQCCILQLPVENAI